LITEVVKSEEYMALAYYRIPAGFRSLEGSPEQMDI